ncbi:MAG: FAA hydrolase family protein [Nitrospinota bacterium]|nr:MAG: FAA hydrolase family protein [Nitrospinota bacterium]
MRLVTFHNGIEPRLGALWTGMVIDLNRACARLLQEKGEPRATALAAALLPPDMRAFLEGGEKSREAAQETLHFVIENSSLLEAEAGKPHPGILYPEAEVTLLAPILNPPKIICLGLNYRDHAEETGQPIPTEPVLFSKYNTALIGPGADIVLPRVSTQVDYEAEFTFIIGKRGHEIPEEVAMEYVAGYTIMNDVSARDFQFKTGQWMVGKTFDTFAPLGPALVSPDEVPDPHSLDIRLELNGEQMQSSNTKHLIFKIPQIIAYLSQIFTLEPGDVVATGTPSGVGFTRDPQRLLQDGDEVVITVEKVGELRNRVVRSKE